MTIDHADHARMADRVPPTGAQVRGRTGRLGLGLATVVLSLAALTACSTGAAEATGSTATGSTATGANVARNTAFDQCMSSHGITKPAGGAPPSSGAKPSGGGADRSRQAPPGVDAAAWQQALAACRSVAGAPPSN